MKVEDIMYLQDLSQNRRTARLAQLTRELEQSRSPEDTLRILERGFAEVDGFVASLLLSTRGLSPGHYRVVGAQLKDEPLSDLPSQAKEEPAPVRRGGILGAIVRRREPQLVQDVDWAHDPVFREMLSGYTSVMAIPLRGGDSLTFCVTPADTTMSINYSTDHFFGSAGVVWAPHSDCGSKFLPPRHSGNGHWPNP